VGSVWHISNWQRRAPLQRHELPKLYKPPPLQAACSAQCTAVYRFATARTSPARVVLLRRVEADPLGAAAEQHAAVVYAQLGCRCLAAGRAHEAVD